MNDAMRAACALWLAMSLVGCDVFTQSCTEIGCVDGLTIALRPPPDGFAAGSYTLELVGEERTVACSFAVPADFLLRRSLDSVQCTPQLDLSVEVSQVQGPQQLGLRSHAQGAPPVLDLRVRRDGTTIVEQRLAPDYETIRPNGPDCEPECRHASMELTLP